MKKKRHVEFERNKTPKYNTLKYGMLEEQNKRLMAMPNVEATT